MHEAKQSYTFESYTPLLALFFYYYHYNPTQMEKKHVDCCFLICMSCLHFMLTDKTITNIQPHLANIAKHAGQVAAQSAGTLVTNLGQSVLNALGAGTTAAPLN